MTNTYSIVTAIAAARRYAGIAAMLLAATFFAFGSSWAQTSQTRSGAMPASQQSQPTTALPPGQSTDGYTLGSGDRVRITVYGQPELTGEFQVDGSGQLSYPLVGQVQAGGLTAKGLEQALIGKLKPNYLKNPSVSVEVLTYRPFYIVGEVRTPGSYPYVSGMTIINAVALAGGFTYRARESSFYLTRTGEDGEKTKVTATPETPVLPGDVITVRERYF